ncbi:MAG: hypothetical protein ACE5G0_00160 [Rhodothermales bacterium]
MSKELHQDNERFEFFGPLERPSPPLTLPFSDTATELTFLRRFEAHPYTLIALRETLVLDLPDADTLRLTDQQVVAQVAWRLASCRLTVTAHPDKHRLVGGGRPEIVPPPESKEEPPSPLTTEPPSPPATEPPPVDDILTNWITFQMVDDETDVPVADVPLKIKLSDGTVGIYVTDAAGRVHIPDLPDGTCDILEILDDDALEIVALS